MPTWTRKLRITRQRRAILDELGKTRAHPTADAVFARVRRRLPRISLATVYRNLLLLAERGMIQVLEQGGSPRRFDGNRVLHDHVRCLRCGQVEDTGLSLPVAHGKAAGAARGYRILGHRLELLGLCPECRTKGRGRNSVGIAEWGQGGETA